jgi:hypothetical protein
MKALLGGKDPRPVTDDKQAGGVDAQFWGAAMLQGGGWGIFGDFLQSGSNRMDGGFAGTLAGPLVGDAQTLWNSAHSKNPAWALSKTARQFLPGGSLWYARLAFDRMATDQLQEAIDPNYRDAWARMAKNAKDQRTKMWWKPGQATPERAPDMSTLIDGPH